ncbi:hypothetical protein Tco_0936854 [Tanacetum coccineum]|uniref:Reverse transcriptase domain-containing protein n=1 Tax=Tanacetum coccineum TaxID=301880 RepID=A0ABQ5DIS5_9ASTR
MGERVGRGGRGRGPRRGNDERIDELNGQGNDQGMGANGGVEGVNGNVKREFKGVVVATYTDRFRELARLVPHLVTPKSRKIERYVYGLALQTRGMVAATKPKTMQKAV